MRDFFAKKIIPNIISFGANRYDNRIVAALWNGRSEPDATVRSTLAIKETAPVFFICGITIDLQSINVRLCTTKKSI